MSLFWFIEGMKSLWQGRWLCGDGSLRRLAHLSFDQKAERGQCWPPGGCLLFIQSGLHPTGCAITFRIDLPPHLIFYGEALSVTQKYTLLTLDINSKQPFLGSSSHFHNGEHMGCCKVDSMLYAH